MACSGLSAVSYFVIALFGALESAGMVGERSSILVRYIAVYGAAMGLFSSVVLIITWNLNNQPSRKEKGLAMMVMNVVGQCGPLVGVSIFPNSDGPHYVNGMIISGLFMLGVVVLAAGLRWILRRMNEQISTHDKGAYEMLRLRAVEDDHEGIVADGPEEEEAEGLVERLGSTVATRRDDRFQYML